jgi:ribosomal RNA-processing protein 12
LTFRKGKDKEAHAYLLPLLASPASTPHPTSLQQFIEYFVPLSERMFEYKLSAETTGGDKGGAEVKMWNVLIGQVWSCFAGFVDYRIREHKSRAYHIVVDKGLLKDVSLLPITCLSSDSSEQIWTPAFSQLLSSLLYNPPEDQKELRSHVLKGLRTVVESMAWKEGELDEEEGNNSHSLLDEAKVVKKSNREFLSSQAESWFGVLFNLFTSNAISKDERGPIGDVIRVWCAISSTEVNHS